MFNWFRNLFRSECVIKVDINVSPVRVFISSGEKEKAVESDNRSGSSVVEQGSSRVIKSTDEDRLQSLEHRLGEKKFGDFNIKFGEECKETDLKKDDENK